VTPEETVAPTDVFHIFFLLWLPADIYWLNSQGDETLRQGRDAREWITTLGQFAKTRPAVTGFVYKGWDAARHWLEIQTP
jgi:hypothetical protein